MSEVPLYCRLSPFVWQVSPWVVEEALLPRFAEYSHYPRCHTHAHTLTHSHTYTLTHSHTHTLTHSHTHTLTHSHTHTFTHSHTYTPTHSHTQTRTLSHSHTRGAGAPTSLSRVLQLPVSSSTSSSSSLLLSSPEFSDTKSMSLNYEPSSEPFHNSAK